MKNLLIISSLCLVMGVSVAHAQESAPVVVEDTRLGIDVGGSLGSSLFNSGINMNDKSGGITLPTFMTLSASVTYNLNDNFFIEFSPMISRVKTISFNVNSIEEFQEDLRDFQGALQDGKVDLSNLHSATLLSLPIVFNAQFDTFISPFVGLGIEPMLTLSESKEGLTDFLPSFQLVAQGGLSLQFESFRVELLKVRIGTMLGSASGLNTVATAGVMYRL